MGYWGHGPFDNDDALDVVDEVVATLVEAASPDARTATDMEFGRARAAMNVLADCTNLPITDRQKAAVVAGVNRLLIVMTSTAEEQDEAVLRKIVAATRAELARFVRRPTVDGEVNVPATLMDPEDLFPKRRGRVRRVK